MDFNNHHIPILALIYSFTLTQNCPNRTISTLYFIFHGYDWNGYVLDTCKFMFRKFIGKHSLIFIWLSIYMPDLMAPKTGLCQQRKSFEIASVAVAKYDLLTQVFVCFQLSKSRPTGLSTRDIYISWFK